MNREETIMARKKTTPAATVKAEGKATTETKTVETKAAEVKATETKAAEAKATEAKATEKKAVETKKAETKPAAKTTRATKKETVVNVYLQYAGKEILAEDIVSKAKAAFVEAGNKEADIRTIDVYVKPEDNAAYFVVNGIGSDDYKVEL